MKRFVKYILVLLAIITTTSCSHNDEQEDKIITNLNDIFDPEHESDTDWNYTEIDEDWLSDFGLYYDKEIKAYRQKKAFQKNNTKSKPINPIPLYITLSVILFLIFEIWLLYATYQLSYRNIGYHGYG